MMTLGRRGFLRIAATAAAAAGSARIARAQDYPSRPITVIVPTGAGGPQDVVARIVTERMRNTLGEPLIIDNVPGASGSIGTGRLARAKPDGYTLGISLSFSTHVLNAAIYTLPYDVIEDFAPVALIAHTPQLILARQSMPADDLKALIAWLKANRTRPRSGTSAQAAPRISPASCSNDRPAPALRS